MTTWFVSRHPGALEWMRREGIAFDAHVPHLDVGCVAEGDVVIGTLPMPLAADVQARGASYWHLELQVPTNKRGQELSADELQALGSSLRPYRVERL